MAHASGVIDGGVKVGVVRDVNRFDESGARDRVQSSLGRLSTVWRGVSAEERGKSLAQRSPVPVTERQKWIEGWRLASSNQSWGQQIGGCTSMEIEEMGADGDTEMLLAFQLEGTIGQMG